MAVSMGGFPSLYKNWDGLSRDFTRVRIECGPIGETQGIQEKVHQGEGCSPPNLTPRASGPSAVTVATTIATMAAVMASANP
jgi:hypothetical protein